MTHHPFDRVIWAALTTRQRSLSEGNAQARRYMAAVAPFAATAEDTTSCFLALRDLIAPRDRVALTHAMPAAARQ